MTRFKGIQDDDIRSSETLLSLSLSLSPGLSIQTCKSKEDGGLNHPWWTIRSGLGLLTCCGPRLGKEEGEQLREKESDFDLFSKFWQ